MYICWNCELRIGDGDVADETSTLCQACKKAINSKAESKKEDQCFIGE